jgi:parvulin-like peptidyl-prolyl isomerase
LLRRLHEIEVMDKVIPAKDIRDFYARTAKAVVLREIYFRLSPRAKPEQEEGVRKTAEEVLKKIQTGEDFATLAKAFSESEESADKGGLVGKLVYSRSEDPLQNTAYSMKIGEVSDLIRTNTGYHIIKVEDIRDNEREPFDKVKHEIKQILRTERGKQIAEATNAYQERILKQEKLEWETENLKVLADRFNDYQSTTRDVILDSLNREPAEFLNQVVVRHRKGEVFVRDVKDKIGLARPNSAVSLRNDGTLKKYIQYFLLIDLLVEKAKEKRLDRHPDLAEELKLRLEKHMVSVMLEKEVFSQMNPTDDDFKAYYEKHKVEKYSIPAKADVQEIHVQDYELAQRIVKMAKSGSDFTQLVRKYTDRKSHKSKDGKLGEFSEGRWGKIGEKAFEMRVGEIGGPVDLGAGKGYSILKLLGKKPRKIRPFDEVLSPVRAHYKSETRQNLEKKWFEDQRTKYQIEIYDNVLESIFQKIVEKKSI